MGDVVTVAELRAALANLPDTDEVRVYAYTEHLGDHETMGIDRVAREFESVTLHLFDKSPAVLSHGTSGHDGPGWYYWSEEYPEEGTCGAFETREEAVVHLTEAGMYVAREEPTP